MILFKLFEYVSESLPPPHRPQKFRWRYVSAVKKIILDIFCYTEELIRNSGMKQHPSAHRIDKIYSFQLSKVNNSDK